MAYGILLAVFRVLDSHRLDVSRWIPAAVTCLQLHSILAAAELTTIQTAADTLHKQFSPLHKPIAP
jgi:hypothetical protein